MILPAPFTDLARQAPYYSPLSEVLNAVGRTLAPKVSCIINLANQGAGLPDGGLFTADQLKRGTGDAVLTAQVPSRGAIEVKPPSDEIRHIARSEQVAGNLARCRQVLVTNLREFTLYGS